MHRKVILILTCLLAGITIVFAQGTLNTGAERTEEYLPLLKGKRVGMVINPTSVIGEEQACLLDTLLSLNRRKRQPDGYSYRLTLRKQ